MTRCWCWWECRESGVSVNRVEHAAHGHVEAGTSLPLAGPRGGYTAQREKTIRTGVLQYMAEGLVFESCDWLRFLEFGSQCEEATDPFLSSMGVSPLREGPAGRCARRDALALGGVARYLVSSSESSSAAPLNYLRGFTEVRDCPQQSHCALALTELRAHFNSQ